MIGRLLHPGWDPQLTSQLGGWDPKWTSQLRRREPTSQLRGRDPKLTSQLRGRDTKLLLALMLRRSWSWLFVSSMLLWETKLLRDTKLLGYT